MQLGHQESFPQGHVYLRETYLGTDSEMDSKYGSGSLALQMSSPWIMSATQAGHSQLSSQFSCQNECMIYYSSSASNLLRNTSVVPRMPMESSVC